MALKKSLLDHNLIVDWKKNRRILLQIWVAIDINKESVLRALSHERQASSPEN